MTPKEFTFDAAYQPQVRAKRGTREIMLDVIIALLPSCRACSLSGLTASS